jgi:polyhydroxyalkanoate synthesis regulator phasin
MITSEFEKAKEKALHARYLYNTGQINFKEAEEMMQDYRKLFNERSAEIAKKYNQKLQKFSVKMFIKYGR